MTLQSSGAISLADVQTEFGGSNPIGINEYYGVAAGVPASGTISLNDFYGKSASYWTSNIMGYADNSFGEINPSAGTTTDQFNGIVIAPGSGNSPVTFTIVLVNDPDTAMTLSLYVGGSINQTWSKSNTGTTTYSHTSTFGGSSLQFRSSITDYDDVGTNDNYASARVGSTTVFYHSYDLYEY
jgi:hypothetical protein